MAIDKAKIEKWKRLNDRFQAVADYELPPESQAAARRWDEFCLMANEAVPALIAEVERLHAERSRELDDLANGIKERWREEVRGLRTAHRVEVGHNDRLRAEVERLQEENERHHRALNVIAMTDGAPVGNMILDMRDEADRLRALLREVEWSGLIAGHEGAGDNASGCPVCRRDEERGHAPDCPLAAALK